jgi:hypothetical protein
MGWYYHAERQQIKEIDSGLFAELVANKNTKAEGWAEIPPPSAGQYWDGSQWVSPPPYVPDVSDRQFFQQAAILGIITQAEALAAVKVGAIPASLQAIVNAIPDEEQKFAADMMLSGATIFQRAHPMTEAIGAAYGWTSQQIDEFFIAASAL